MKFIDIDKDKIPYEFELNLAKETFQFQIQYNGVGDFFSLHLYKDHIPIVYGAKLVYGTPLFDNLRHLNVPRVVLLPYDMTKPSKTKLERITYDNLGEDVFLYVLD